MGRRTLSPRTRRALNAVDADVTAVETESAASTAAVADLLCVPTLAYAISARVLHIEWNIPPAAVTLTAADWVVTVNGSAKTTSTAVCSNGVVVITLNADAFSPISKVPDGAYAITVTYDGTDTTFKDQVGSGRAIGAFTGVAAKAAFPRFDLAVFTGDSGSGGVTGLVPAPAAGDAAASAVLMADGTWSGAIVETLTTVSGVASTAGALANAHEAILAPGQDITGTIATVDSKAVTVTDGIVTALTAGGLSDQFVLAAEVFR